MTSGHATEARTSSLTALEITTGRRTLEFNRDLLEPNAHLGPGLHDALADEDVSLG